MKSFKTSLLLLALFTLSLNSFAQMGEMPYVEVIGESSATLAPNKIDVRINISEEPSKGRVSLSELENRLSKALRRFKPTSIDDIKVVSQSSVAVKKSDTYQQKTYTLTLNSGEDVTLLFKELKDNEVGTAVVTKMVNDSTEQIRRKLKIKAMRNAQKSAKILANSVGQEIGMAIKISDFSGNSDAVAYGGGGYLARSMSYDSAANSAEGMPEDLEFQPITLRQSVTVRFELLPKRLECSGVPLEK